MAQKLVGEGCVICIESVSASVDDEGGRASEGPSTERTFHSKTRCCSSVVDEDEDDFLCWSFRKRRGEAAILSGEGGTDGRRVGPLLEEMNVLEAEVVNVSALLEGFCGFRSVQHYMHKGDEKI